MNRDTVYMKSYNVNERSGENHKIELENTVKRISLEKMFGTKVATKIDDQQNIKPEKSKKKKKDKKNREKKTVLETKLQMSDTLMHKSDTLMFNTLSDTITAVDVPSDSTTILQ